MGSAITGINRSVTRHPGVRRPQDLLRRALFRRRDQRLATARTSSPRGAECRWLTVEEAELIRRLPGIRDVNIGEYSRRPGQLRGRQPEERRHVGASAPSWIQVNGGDIVAGRTFTPVEYAAGRSRRRDQRQAGRDALSRPRSDRARPIKIVRRAVPGDRRLSLRRPASMFGDADEPPARHPAHGRSPRWPTTSAAWMEIAVMPTETVTHDRRAGRGHRRDAQRAAGSSRPTRTISRSSPRTSCWRPSTRSSAGFFVVDDRALQRRRSWWAASGVVAIMMISVTERTREIGVRKALGATRGEIMFQFLVEAATLTLIGCLIGMALGALVAWGIRSLQPHPRHRAARLGRGRRGGVGAHGCAVRPAIRRARRRGWIRWRR